MSFKNRTPEQRAAMAKKSAETRRANKALREPPPDEIAWHVERQAELEATDAIPEIAELTEDFSAPEIVYGEIEDTEPAPVPEAVDISPFGLYLAGLSNATRDAFSIDELRDIYDAHVADALAEKKKALKKSAGEQAKHAARMAAGLIPMATIQDMETAKRNAEMVRFTVELPPAGDNGEVADIGLRIDQRVFLHGHTYILPRAQADFFREQIYRAREHELIFKGQNRRMRQYMQSSMDSNRWHIGAQSE